MIDILVLIPALDEQSALLKRCIVENREFLSDKGFTCAFTNDLNLIDKYSKHNPTLCITRWYNDIIYMPYTLHYMCRLLLYPAFTGNVRYNKVSTASFIFTNPVTYHSTTKIMSSEAPKYAMWTVGSENNKKMYIEKEYQFLVLKTYDDIPDNVQLVLNYPEFFASSEASSNPRLPDQI